MHRFVVLVVAASAAVALVRGADPSYKLARVPPKSPADERASFAVRPGFRVELVASEPLVRSPVAVDFDEDGRLFVVEYRDYNQFAHPAGKAVRGCVKVLTDADGDGVYDTASTLADDLESPVAVACWGGGAFVGVVPDLWYFKDTDGDGRADVRRKVLTGFDRDKAGEAMLNSLRWGLDNRFVISTGTAGGTLRRADDQTAKAVSVRRQNVRLDPRTGAFEPTSGGGQHGLTLDDWNDVFVCDNSNPVSHLAYDARYLQRNPHVVAPPAAADINASGKFAGLHRISPPEPWREARTRLRKDKLFPGPDEGGRPFGFFTGATGVTVYRGDAFPAEFRGSAFVGEVANNLVYRARLEPKDGGWSAVRAEDGREFLAARDVWFRPVQFANAPDGTLWVIDMYRELIETAVAIPPQMLQYVDVAGGIDHGRLWRVVPDGVTPRKTPRLGKATTSELVALLDHPNGWHRDTASRLLYERQDRSAVPALRELASAKSALTRTHARYALHGLGALTADDVASALADPEPRAREHALRLAEGFADSPGMPTKVAALGADPDPRVRTQAAFSLGPFPASVTAPSLARLAVTDGTRPAARLAVLCSAHGCGGELFTKMLPERGASSVRSMLVALASQVAAGGNGADLAAVAAGIDGLPDGDRAFAAELVRAVAGKLSPSGREKFATGKAGVIFADLLSSAVRTAGDERADPAARASAVAALPLGKWADAKPVLAAALGVKQPPAVRLAALDALARFDSPDVPAVVLAAWPAMAPDTRATATETLLARSAWVPAFLAAVEAGTVRATDVPPARVQLLRAAADPTVRQRAERLFAAPSKRADVIARYRKALDLTGDPARGNIVFRDNCSACHRLDGVGTAVGPDLSAMKDRGSETVLTNVLDPNREVLPQYATYLLTTEADAVVTGMIAAETANTITIRKADGRTETVQRSDVQSLRGTGLSAMPEGLEEKIPVPAMADLLAFLASIK